MRILVLAAVASLTLWSAEANAVENFIPLGQNYAPGDSVLPALNSPQDKVNAQVDIYQSEIYTRQRYNKEQNSYVRRFLNSQQGNGGSYGYIDY